MKKWNNGLRLALCIGLMSSSLAVRANDLSEQQMPQMTYQGKPITLEFQEIPVRAALDVLARFSGQNIVVDDSVSGNITLRLTNVPWDQVLDMIAQSQSLSIINQDGIMFISSKTLQSTGALQTRHIRLKYAMAEEVQRLIAGEKTYHSQHKKNDVVRAYNRLVPISSNVEDKTIIESERLGLLSEQGTVTVDKRTNTLIIQDNSKRLDGIVQLIEQIDIPMKQVMIEARIVSAHENFGRQLGVNFGVSGQHGKWQYASSNRSLWAMQGQLNPQELSDQDRLNVNLGVTNGVGKIAFGFLNLPNAILDLELSAMQANQHGEIISTPKVLTADKQTARISSGVQIPYQEASASGATSTSFKEASLVLEATPNITPDGKIALKLNIKNGTPITNLGNVAIQEDAIETNVLVSDGQTLVLGGIYRQNRSNGVNKVPFLGDVPVLGRLFRSDSRSDDKSELLIFITPTLVDDGIDAQKN
ncbi:type IV pilus secretin PilQ [Moraxella nasicaprae]|uniref:Type IV pilus secretin PilQ n=1 Tax=Moraxella nasicaprae TaxID=2904122 RepID=A0ABY6F385_9GAMM|nr:type IV pilus secretin PilQ [Moraxella nasicaprae]UXZ04457.1 type IV pilus secretin PilQ [Moraxella nasicaprae]